MEKGTLKKIKNTALAIGTSVILLYLILSLIESKSKVTSFIILLPVLIWPYIAYKDEKKASIFAFVIGAITIIWFAVDFIFLRAQQLYWHIPVFILIAPLPAFIIGYIFWIYSKE